jgi:hypothetical protein
MQGEFPELAHELILRQRRLTVFASDPAHSADAGVLNVRL